MYRHPYLMSFPAFLVLTLFGGILVRSIWIQDSLPGRYRGLAQAAIENSQFELGQTYYERVIQLGKKREPDDELNLALTMFRTDDVEAGQALLDRLAPDQGVGFPKAHRLKAIQWVAALMGTNRDENSVSTDAPDHTTLSQSAWELVRLHLTRSGLEQPVELADLWTAYFLASGKPSEAIAQQMAISKLQPDRWFATSRLCASLNDEAQRKLASDQAEAYLTAKITENPFDHPARIDLARVYVENQRVQEAGTLMLQGLKLADTDTSPQAMALRRAASDFLLLRIDSMKNDSDSDLAKKHALVTKAIELDSSNLRAYGKMLELYQAESLPENRKAMIRILEQQIVQGGSIAVSHFALGFANWVDGNRDSAVWHTERALELEPRMSEVMNNVAWMLAHSDSPDLQRALTLIDAALQKDPKDLRFRDTKGVILMKMQRWDEALTEFESILPVAGQRDRGSIHQNLAEIYSALGRNRLADLHRAQAAETTQPDE